MAPCTAHHRSAVDCGCNRAGGGAQSCGPTCAYGAPGDSHCPFPRVWQGLCPPKEWTPGWGQCVQQGWEIYLVLLGSPVPPPPRLSPAIPPVLDTAMRPRGLQARSFRGTCSPLTLTQDVNLFWWHFKLP